MTRHVEHVVHRYKDTLRELTKVTKRDASGLRRDGKTRVKLADVVNDTPFDKSFVLLNKKNMRPLLSWVVITHKRHIAVMCKVEEQ